MPKKILLNDRINNFIKRCEENNILLNLNIKNTIIEIITYYINEKNWLKNNIENALFDMLFFDKNNIISLDRMKKWYNIKKFNFDKATLRYGEEEGLKKWNQYIEKQKITNTFEYKNKKYGMTKEDFIAYNKKRSCTKNNFILRYGEEGLKKWNQYIEKQKINGCCKEWFIKKLGEEEGLKKWNKINFYKSHSVDSIMERKNITEEEAINILKKFYDNCKLRNSYSKISQKLFWQIYEKLKTTYHNIFFAELNHEFGKYDKKLKKYYFYDFVIEDINFCIEFQGDNYHGNPKYYKPSDKLKAHGVTNLIVKDVWMKDKLKKETLLNCGFDLIYVWEDDYKSNEEKVLELCLERIKKLKRVKTSL